jgi:hypothetical protein
VARTDDDADRTQVDNGAIFRLENRDRAVVLDRTAVVVGTRRTTAIETRREIEQQPGTGAPHAGARCAERLEAPHHLVEGCRLRGTSLDGRMRGERRFAAAGAEEAENDYAPCPQRLAGDENVQRRAE